MIKVQTNRGVVVEIPFSELKGQRREDGRFYVKLKDGSEGSGCLGRSQRIGRGTKARGTGPKSWLTLPAYLITAWTTESYSQFTHAKDL